MSATRVPWMRGAPQRKFARAISRISWRVSRAIAGRPPRQRPTRSIFPDQSDTVTAPAQDRFGLNDFQCVAPGRPPPRHKHPEQPIDGAPRPGASEHCQLLLQCNALPNQCSAGTMICPGRFNGVAVESNHWQSLCPTAAIRQRSGSDEVESERGAVAWAMRQRSVSSPRSSNRSWGPPSGSRTRPQAFALGRP
jgi:hypothetical protein